MRSKQLLRLYIYIQYNHSTYIYFVSFSGWLKLSNEHFIFACDHHFCAHFIPKKAPKKPRRFDIVSLDAFIFSFCLLVYYLFLAMMFRCGDSLYFYSILFYIFCSSSFVDLHTKFSMQITNCTALNHIQRTLHASEENEKKIVETEKSATK